MAHSPDPRPDRKQLSADELIAVFVALSSIGAIFFWSISQKGSFDQPFIQAPAVISKPTATPLPTPPVAPSASASTQIGAVNSSASALPSPQLASPSPTPVPAAPLIVAVPQASVAPSPATSAVPARPAATPKQFADVPSGFWASVPIAALSAQGIVDGFPDGSFQPNKSVTRAEFAEMVRRAFKRPASREVIKFNDLEAGYWAIGAIDQATQTRFMSGFPNGSFQPNRKIPRLQALLALATGLNLQAKLPPQQVLSRYQDAEQIPSYAIDKIAAATEAGLVLDNANSNLLSPNRVTTRAEAAALIYEALKK